MASQPVVVELFLDGVWTDITDDVYTRDNIEITHGRADESSQPAPSSCKLTLDNRTGTYNPKNAASPLFGKIGRNTQLRVRFAGRVRFHGEVSSWTPRLAVDDGDAWTMVEADGVSRRLGQGATPLQSSLRRGIEASPSVVAYWPLEDDDDATGLASALPGHPGMWFLGSPDLSSFSSYLASKPIPVLSGALLSGEVPAHTGTGEIQVRFLMAVPAAGEAADSIVCLVGLTGGTVARVDLIVAAVNGNLRLVARDADGVFLHDTGFVSFLTAGKLLRVSVELVQVGADVSLTMKTLELFGPGLQFGQTMVGHTLGRAATVRLNADRVLDATALGHVSVQTVITSLNDLDDELAGWAGETALHRIQRLAVEEDVTLTGVGSGIDTSAALGPQPPDTFLNIARQAADVDMGILFDMFDGLGLYYESLPNRYNRPVQVDLTLTLDFAAGQVSPPLEPVVDDQATRNDVTTTRPSGSSARQVLTEGALSVAAPPDGVGRYAEELTLNIVGDGFLPNQASWRLHVGTVDEIRFPQVTVDLDQLADIFSVERMQVGFRILITNLPDTIAHDDVSLIIQGYTETIGSHRRTITFNTTPESPYQVGVFGADARNDRYDTAGSELLAAVTSTATAFDVTTLVGPEWTSDNTEDGFDIEVGGERMTVTDISAPIPNRTFTVVRSVNGVVKAHPAGTPVSLWQPAVYAL